MHAGLVCGSSIRMLNKFINMTKQQIINKTADYAEGKLKGEGSGHDWWHIYRVWMSAKEIGKKEKGDMFVIELTALLHDIADWKFTGGDDSIGPKLASEWLLKLKVDKKVVDRVATIIKEMSFKGAGVKTPMSTIEGEVVQDADRLDAIGAVGIARTFAYGGHKGREMYNPNIKPTAHKSFDAYKKNNSPTINHFYEKLLLLKDLLNTKTAKQIATQRHKFMEKYLSQFFAEWEGKK